jgi:glycogen debranching enzyme
MVARRIEWEPLIRFGRAICGDLDAALRREWLVTNGLGGYASGTISGVNTRRYHGLLVAALAPPVERTVLVAGLVGWVSHEGQRHSLAANEYADGTIDPRGYANVEAFSLDGTLPVWTYALGEARLERRVWMAYGSNTTYVSYELLRADGPATLMVSPLVTYHDYHALSSGHGWQPDISRDGQAVVVRAFDGAVPYRLVADGGTFQQGGDWWWNFHYRAETARGLDDRGDLFNPGMYTVTLEPGERWTVVLTTEPSVDLDTVRAAPGQPAPALVAEQARQAALLARAGTAEKHQLVRQLTLAADQFVVQRWSTLASPDAAAAPPQADSTGPPAAPTERPIGKTVIAGYHWFNDWGRDTMIALPGLTLSTGRPADGASIMRAFAPYVADGLLPNNFPDRAGVEPGYNTADAALWYVLAVRAHHAATGDEALVDELLPTLRSIADHYARGTRYGIGVDPADGLLRAGEPGVQLTWMDAKVGDWVVSPRIGKAVELNALWYNVLRTLAAFLGSDGGRAARDAAGAAAYADQADRLQASFRARFVQRGARYLADVVDTPQGGDDLSVRPNQIFAVSLPYPLLEGADARAVVDAVGEALLASYGLRSLSPDDPAYHGSYGGDQRQRDGAYHQGPVWGWLAGAYAEAYYRVHGDAAAALAILEPFEDHLHDAGLGSISEIFDGDPPHPAHGCIAQAWSVAEVLRVWRALSEA